jgi:hypothetical protein
MGTEQTEGADAALLAALREIVTICTESQGAFRKRMGTRLGNILVTAQAAIAQAEAATAAAEAVSPAVRRYVDNACRQARAQAVQEARITLRKDAARSPR